jgi:hypothetical protein
MGRYEEEGGISVMRLDIARGAKRLDEHIRLNTAFLSLTKLLSLLASSRSLCICASARSRNRPTTMLVSA